MTDLIRDGAHAAIEKISADHFLALVTYPSKK
jgi:hypothetical protein